MVSATTLLEWKRSTGENKEQQRQKINVTKVKTATSVREKRITEYIFVKINLFD